MRRNTKFSSQSNAAINRVPRFESSPDLIGLLCREISFSVLGVISDVLRPSSPSEVIPPVIPRHPVLVETFFPLRGRANEGFQNQNMNRPRVAFPTSHRQMPAFYHSGSQHLSSVKTVLAVRSLDNSILGTDPTEVAHLITGVVQAIFPYLHVLGHYDLRTVRRSSAPTVTCRMAPSPSRT